MYKSWFHSFTILYVVLLLSSCGQTLVDDVLKVNSTPNTLPWNGLDSIELITGESLKLSWTALDGTADNYKIYSIAGGSATLAHTIEGLSNAYTFSGLNLNQSYTYRVRVVTDGTEDTNTNDISSSTLSWNNLETVDLVTGDSLKLSWTAYDGAADNYKIYSIAGGSSTLQATTNSSTTSYTFSGLNLNQSYTYRVRVVFAGDEDLNTTDISSSTLSWNNLETVDLVAGDSLKLSWTAYDGAADNYKIYSIAGGSSTLQATTNSSTTSYTFSGLNLNQSYTYRVRVVFAGDEDLNTNDISISTLAVTASHQGWEHIKALGGRTPVSQSGLATTNPSVFLKWKAMTLSSSTVSNYNIYRSTTSASQNFSSPLSSGISTALMEYTDTTASAGETYYYVVRPVVDSEIVPTTENDSEIKIVTPPSNMSLVHRWIANQEMCERMGKTPDRDNNYRCAYTGLGNTGNFYDLGYSLLVDTVELGCNYSLGVCDGTNDCLSASVSNPDTVVSAVAGTIYFSRLGKTCYINTDSATAWSRVRRANTLSAAQINQATSINPGLPPIGGVTQEEAWKICESKTLSGFSGSKRLLRRKEFVVSAAWDASLSDAQINTIENGYNLNTTNNCNVNNSHGVTHDDLDIPANLESLPQAASFAGGNWIGLLRSGGNYTSNCVSRYGIQNMVGNILEWNSDQCEWSGTTCNVPASPLDVENSDIEAWVTTTTSNGQFSSVASYFLLPLGLPWGANDDGTVTSSSYSNIHNDRFIINNSGIRGFLSGGDWWNGSNAGKYSLKVNSTPDYSDFQLGLRCALELP